MPELYSSNHIISVLIEEGFQEVSQKGSHKKFSKGNRRVVVPSPRAYSADFLFMQIEKCFDIMHNK